jgi:hypothetical protein
MRIIDLLCKSGHVSIGNVFSKKMPVQLQNIVLAPICVHTVLIVLILWSTWYHLQNSVMISYVLTFSWNWKNTTNRRASMDCQGTWTQLYWTDQVIMLRAFDSRTSLPFFIGVIFVLMWTVVTLGTGLIVNKNNSFHVVCSALETKLASNMIKYDIRCLGLYHILWQFGSFIVWMFDSFSTQVGKA